MRLGCDEEINARGESGGSQRRERGDPENVKEKENGKVQPPSTFGSSVRSADVLKRAPRSSCNPFSMGIQQQVIDGSPSNLYTTLTNKTTLLEGGRSVQFKKEGMLKEDATA